MIAIDVPGIPQGKARPRFGRGRVYSAPKMVEREHDIGWIAKQAMEKRPPLTGPLSVTIQAYMPVSIRWSDRKITKAVSQQTRPVGKPDIDNIVKSVLDSCNKIVWEDDKQIVDLHVHKLYAMIPSIHVEVTEL